MTFFVLSSTTSEVGSAVFLGYSYYRILLLCAVLLPIGLVGWGLLQTYLSPQFYANAISLLDQLYDNPRARTILAIGSVIISFVGAVLLLMPPQRMGEYWAIVDRLYPVFGLFFALGLQILSILFLWRYEPVNWLEFGDTKKGFVAGGWIFIVFMMILAVISFSGIGWVPEKSGWNFPGTPIVFYQLVFAWGLSFLYVIKTKDNNFLDGDKLGDTPVLRFDIYLCLLFFIAAVLLWSGQPLSRGNYFTPNPTPPNFEYYPYSDSSFYDRSAQLILIGEGQNSTVVLRPLYVFALAAFHALVGQDFDNVIFLQTIFLAFIPVFAYLLVSNMGGRASGGMMAILIIFRGWNSIALNNVIEVTHSKLILSDLPTMGLLVVTVYFFVSWLQIPNGLDYRGVLAGAFLGLTVLIRSQSQLLLPVFLIGMLFSGGVQAKRIIARFLVFMIGFLVVVIPWVWRNYELNGRPAVENTEFYIRLFAGGYSEPTDTIDQFPGESFEEYSARIKNQILRYVFNHPVEVTRTWISYFIHNEISSIFSLPMSFKLYDPWLYVKVMPFWIDRQPDLSFENIFFLVLTLGVISIGIGHTTNRLGVPGFMPLLIHFSYSLSVVPARISGWRYIFPVDWILHMYYVVGLMALTIFAISYVINRPAIFVNISKQPERPDIGSSNKKVLFYSFLFAVVGLSLPVAERLAPQRYPPLPPNELIQNQVRNSLVVDNGVDVSASDLMSFIEDEAGATVLYGRALYPSYYEKGEFWGESSKNLLEASEYNRLQFNLIGSDNEFVFIPLQTPPTYFPNASDVFIVGCDQDASIRALIVKVNDVVVAASPWNGLRCSTLE